MTMIRRGLFSALGLGLLLGLAACSSTGPAGPLAGAGAPVTARLQGPNPSPRSSTSSSVSRRATPSSADQGRSAASPPRSGQQAQANSAGGCYPLSDENTCYQPGEFCRDDDHGVTGRTAAGETIICMDNDGWRWEPVGGSSSGGRPSPRPTSSSRPTPPVTSTPTPSGTASPTPPSTTSPPTTPTPDMVDYR
jgi:hypothetical protein